MRTFKFRGLNVANGEWSYGSLVIVDDNFHILEDEETTTHDYNRVDEETVGQFTGLHDKLGNEVYEGDLLSRNIGLTYQVYWNNNESDFNMKNTSWADDDFPMNFYNVEGRFEVIGNIHDNPELVK